MAILGPVAPVDRTPRVRTELDDLDDTIAALEVSWEEPRLLYRWMKWLLWFRFPAAPAAPIEAPPALRSDLPRIIQRPTEPMYF